MTGKDRSGEFYTITLFVPIELPNKFDTVKSEWPIVYSKGFQVVISKKKKNFFV